MPKSRDRSRRDTKLESEGAEFLVLGRLLLEKGGTAGRPFHFSIWFKIMFPRLSF